MNLWLERGRSVLRRKFVQDTLALQAARIVVNGMSAAGVLIVLRLLGPAGMGVVTLALSYYNTWRSLDFTGVSTSTLARLGIALGAHDDEGALDLMGFYIKAQVVVVLGLTALLLVIGAPVAERLYDGDSTVGALAAVLALGWLPDSLYTLALLALQSRRSMRAVAILQIANQAVLTICQIGAAVISPTPQAQVIGRLIYSFVTVIMALVAYERLRGAGAMPLPSLWAAARRAVTVSPRPFWRFSFANALDKNLANLYIQLPTQLVGIVAGNTAVGYLGVGLSITNRAGLITGAVFDNLSAFVPQAVGRKEYARLWRNVQRVLIGLALGGAAYYGAIIVGGLLFAPIIVPFLLGDAWLPALPAVLSLALYGAVTAVGGVFGALYRSLGLMRGALILKAIPLLVVLPIAALLMLAWGAGQGAYAAFLGAPAPNLAVGGAVAGAWIINALFILSVSLTGALTLPVLRARAQTAPTDDVK